MRAADGAGPVYRVVFDTNVLLSAFVFGGTPEKLWQCARSGQIALVTSPQMLAEFASVLENKFGWAEADAVDAVKTVGYSAELVKPTPHLSVVDDDADNRILEAALEAKAQFIVSGDKHLVGMEQFEGIRIVRAADLLRVL